MIYFKRWKLRGAILLPFALAAMTPREPAKAAEAGQSTPAEIHDQARPSTEKTQALQLLAQRDAIVNEVGFLLARAAAPECPGQTEQAGFALHSASQYAPVWRESVQDLFGIADQVAFAAIAAESAPAAAGLQVGDQIVAINGARFGPGNNDPQASFAQTDRIYEQLLGALQRGQADLLVRRGGIDIPIRIEARAGCAVVFQIRSGKGLTATSGRQWISISDEMVAFAADESELAYILAHELAHVVLGDADRRSPRRVSARQREQRADLAGQMLAACAGFDPSAGARFWQRYGKARPLAALGSFHHAPPSSRARAIAERAASLARDPRSGCPPWPDAQIG